MSKQPEPVTIDSSVYKHTFYGILNAEGELWTPLAYHSKADARKPLQEWADRGRPSMLETHKIVPVRIQLTVIPEEDTPA